MEAKEKVSFIHSITAKIMLMVVVMVALSLMACISIANVRASATVNNVNENFILSLTESAAKTLDKIPAEVDFSTQCAAVMQDMGLVIFPASDEASMHHIRCFISNRAVRGIFNGNCKLLHLF